MAISLQKGQNIDLSKDKQTQLSKVCVGLNWGVIEKVVHLVVPGFLGFGSKKISKEVKIDVDLDASCVVVGPDKEAIEVISFRQLQSKYGCIIHSGDDRSGDKEGDDGLDNEIITTDLTGLPKNVEQVVFFLNSYKKQSFSEIPFASIRIYEGTPDHVDKVLATYDVAKDSRFSNKVSMVMGKFIRQDENWLFNAIGEPLEASSLDETVDAVLHDYL
jgi:tellurium resistance protein TerZ